MLVILQAEHLARSKRLPGLDELTGKAPRKKKVLARDADPAKPPMTREEKAAAWAAEMAKLQVIAPKENGHGG